MLTHLIVRHSPLKNREALYGDRTEAMRLYYEISEHETIEYCDVISLYPYICKYFKFPIGHTINHVGDTCSKVEACLQIDGRSLTVANQTVDCDCGVGGRLWLSEGQRQVKEQVAWLSDSTRTARVVAV